VGLIALGASTVNRWLARAGNRQKLGRRLLTAPIVGALVQGTETVRFARMLESMLGKTAETFETRVEQKLKRLLTLLEPVLILGLGAVIALVIVSILMAMFGVNELVV
jgi:general secretion pathway protein F